MPATGVHIDRADDLGPEFDTRADLCRITVLTEPDIRFLTHVNMRRRSLSIDRAESDETGRTSHLRIVRAVTDEMRALDRSLQHFRTGSLIRMVLQGAGGAFFANSIFLDEYVMASTTAGGDVDPSSPARVSHVDKAVSKLVDRIRELVGQPSLNPGGWFEIPPESEHADEVPAEAVHEEALHPDGGTALPSFRNAVARGSLQYAALFRGTDQLLEVDTFESNTVKQFLTRIPPQIRREFYREFGRLAERNVAELARVSAAATGAPLLRAVFDVEQGAIFYYRVGDDRHLIGMTLDQSAVAAADHHAAALAVDCR
ncbi:hypothetical protein [Actinoplanes sp. NPDC049802]|uniref:hypothetical protein n=1 Tax=Actinoplanes sp. NPDC049802 TaxID=3154742 RepID=UPI0033D8978C